MIKHSLFPGLTTLRISNIKEKLLVICIKFAFGGYQTTNGVFVQGVTFLRIKVV